MLQYYILSYRLKENNLEVEIYGFENIIAFINWTSEISNINLHYLIIPIRILTRQKEIRNTINQRNKSFSCRFSRTEKLSWCLRNSPKERAQNIQVVLSPRCTNAYILLLQYIKIHTWIHLVSMFDDPLLFLDQVYMVFHCLK